MSGCSYVNYNRLPFKNQYFGLKYFYDLCYINKKRNGVRNMNERLKEVELKLKHMKLLYKERKIPHSYYENSLRDLHYRYDRYQNEHGIHGLSEWDVFWLKDVFEARFFDIGVLRFQIFEMDHALIERSDYDYMPLSDAIKKRFPEGQFYLNVHIVKDANLEPGLVSASFEEARVFFKTYFSEMTFDYFICRTWLLDESLEHLLPPTSNILAFRNQFEILTRNYHKGHPLLRIYGSDDLDEIAQMDHQSSLQKKAYLHADTLGVSFGCIPF